MKTEAEKHLSPLTGRAPAAEVASVPAASVAGEVNAGPEAHPSPASPGAEGAEGRAQTRLKTLWREYFESAVVTLIMALFFMTFVGQAAAVPSASMQNTILVGDRFLINKFIFAPGESLPFLPQREIRRGDIIVFKYPGNRAHPEQDTDPEVVRYQTFFIKRVIGLPGDQIEVRGADVLINGQALAEQRVAAVRDDAKSPLRVLSTAPGDDAGAPYRVYYDPQTLVTTRDGLTRSPSYFNYAVDGAPVVVPADSYFVMGDNRDDSADSRVWGFVPRDLVVGRAMFVIWSYDESAPKSGNLLIDFFKNTRWKRTGTLIK